MSAHSSSLLSHLSKHKLLLVICLVLAFQAGIHSANFSSYNNSKLNTFLNEPLLTTPDGYFYLRYAKEWQNGTYNSTPELRIPRRPTHTPPLSILTAVASSITNFSLEKIAFYLTPILASTIFIIAIWSGLALNSGSLPAVICSVFTAAAPIWYTRTRLGYFDTDALNLTLLWAIGLCLYNADATSKKHLLFWFGSAAASTLLLHYWWPQAGLPFAGIMWGTYAASVCIPSNVTARKLKMLLLFCGAIFITWTLFGPLNIIPSPIKELMASLRSHLALSANNQSSMFTGTGNTIAELIPVKFTKLPQQLSGHWIIFCCAILGTAVAWRKNSILCFYFLLPASFFLVASVTIGNRFLMFAAPAFGLFTAAFLSGLLEQKKIAEIKVLKWGLVIAFSCLLIFPVTLDLNRPLKATYNYNKAVLAKVIGTKSSPDAKIWNWWSPGYFLQYYAERFTQIDGGLQAPERSFIAALPLATQNPTLARNWIKLFSDKPHALNFIARHLKSKAKAVAFLQEALSTPQNLKSLLQSYNLPVNIDWHHWLFPTTEVYLTLYSDMLTRNTWLSRGLWSPATQTSPETPMVSFSLPQVQVDQQQGRVKFSQKRYIPCSRMYYITPTSLSHDRFKQKGVVGIFLQDSNNGFAIQQEFFNATAFRLLFIHPSNTPGFTPLIYNPFIGGVWRVS